GDGHIAALVMEGIDGCEALITHGAAGDIPMEILKGTRQWPDDEWEAAGLRLATRGWLRGEYLTPRGQKVRKRVEENTDLRALLPWTALGQRSSDRLRELVRPWSRTISEGGIFSRSTR